MLSSLGGNKGVTYDTRLFKLCFNRETNFEFSRQFCQYIHILFCALQTFFFFNMASKEIEQKWKKMTD